MLLISFMDLFYLNYEYHWLYHSLPRIQNPQTNLYCHKVCSTLRYYVCKQEQGVFSRTIYYSCSEKATSSSDPGKDRKIPQDNEEHHKTLAGGSKGKNKLKRELRQLDKGQLEYCG